VPGLIVGLEIFGMSVTVYIYSYSPLESSRYALEDSIEEDFEGAVELSGGGSGSTGWNIDLEILDDSTSPAMIDSLLVYLRNRKVPRDTYLVVFPPDSNGPEGRRELRVYAEDKVQEVTQSPDNSNEN
jgi:hypothetical protein